MKTEAIMIFDRDEEDGKSVAIYKEENGFLAMTYTDSKSFKTLNGAIRWMAKRGFEEGE